MKSTVPSCRVDSEDWWFHNQAGLIAELSRRRAGDELDLEADGNCPANRHVLLVRGEIRSAHFHVVWVGRDVRQPEGTVSIGCNRLFVIRHAIGNGDGCLGNAAPEGSVTV